MYLVGFTVQIHFRIALTFSFMKDETGEGTVPVILNLALDGGKRLA